MSQEDSEKENDDALRRFIDRLENWPEDEPPTPVELRNLRQEIRLTQDERDKLEILSENHIRRARSSLAAGSYDQAAAELARAAQLRPLDARPKTELAGIYLQRSLERGYGRNDRSKAIKLARKALELHPGDPDALAFLKEYRRMNADFRSARYRRYLIPGFSALALLITMAIWQRDWVVGFLSPSPAASGAATVPVTPVISEGESRSLEVRLPGLENGSLEADIVRASIGRRNDSSYVDIQGRVKSLSSTVGAMRLLVRGYNDAGETLFALPVDFRDDRAPLLRPGDSQSLTVFRWLAEDESGIDYLDLDILKLDLLEDAPAYIPSSAELVWETSRPDGAGLNAEVRDIKVYEAFDRQVLLMDLALTNTGVQDLGDITLDISLGSEWTSLPHRSVGLNEPAMERGERRVWPIAMGFPLDADLEGRPVTVRVTEAGR